MELFTVREHAEHYVQQENRTLIETAEYIVTTEPNLNPKDRKEFIREVQRIRKELSK